MKRLSITAAILAVCFLSIFGLGEYTKYATAKAMTAYAPPPVVVSAHESVNATWKQYLQAVGTVSSLSSLEIRPETSGTIVQVHISSGESVKAGTPLFDVSHKVESAGISGASQDVLRTKHEYDRFQALYKQKVVSENTLQKYHDLYSEAQSRLTKLIKRIDRKTIKAPFDGVLGINKVGLGQYVVPGQPLIHLTSLSPIYIDFSLRQQDVGKITQGLAVQAEVDGRPEKFFKGFISAINPFLSPKTRQVSVRASFSNKDHKLVPGMFSNVRVQLAQSLNHVIVPETAVTLRLSGDTVWVLNSASDKQNEKDKLWTAHPVLVKVTQSRNGWTAIKSGIKAGQMIVTSGQIKLYPGAQVSIDNKITPAVPAPSK